MNRKLVFGTLLVAVLAFSIAVAVDYYQKTVQLGWTVVPAEGIEVFPDVLMFGEIEQGKNATSSFTVSNVADTPLNVTIPDLVPSYVAMIMDHLGSYMIDVEPNTFILEVNQTQTVNVTIVTEEALETGTYTAKLTVTAYPI